MGTRPLMLWRTLSLPTVRPLATPGMAVDLSSPSVLLSAGDGTGGEMEDVTKSVWSGVWSPSLVSLFYSSMAVSCHKTSHKFRASEYKNTSFGHRFKSIFLLIH